MHFIKDAKFLSQREKFLIIEKSIFFIKQKIVNKALISSLFFTMYIYIYIAFNLVKSKFKESLVKEFSQHR